MKPGKQAKRISAYEAMTNAGFELETNLGDATVPACCSEGCAVEPDGKCSHGFPSVLLVLGYV